MLQRRVQNYKSLLSIVCALILSAAVANPANAILDELIKYIRNKYRSSTTHVVVIGINEYSRARSLDYAVNDAKAVIELFGALGFTIHPPLLRTEPTPESHITRSRIRNSVRKVLQEAKEDDRVIVFYAGHGREILDRFGRIEAYLLTSNFDPKDVTGTALAFKDLVRQASEQGVKAKHIMFVLDACYAADALNLEKGRDELAEADDPYIQHIVESPGVVAITAGDNGQPVKEKGGHGVFTKLFIRGLSGDADTDVNGVVHFEELAVWLRPHVFKASGNFKQVVKYGKLAPGAGEPVFLVPEEETRRKVLGDLVANEIKASLIKRCNKIGKRNCPYLARSPLPDPGPEDIGGGPLAPSASVVTEAQAALQALGFVVGAAGQLDRRTEDALLAFQSFASLPKTGVPDAATLLKLARMRNRQHTELSALRDDEINIIIVYQIGAEPTVDALTARLNAAGVDYTLSETYNVPSRISGYLYFGQDRTGAAQALRALSEGLVDLRLTPSATAGDTLRLIVGLD